MSKIRKCPDGHRCENGSSCAEHPTEEGSYYCDCGTSDGDFAGLFCEYEAETYCQMEQETASHSFCSNRGTCVLSTNNGGAQWNCDCPAEFEGPHCQFVTGNVPRDWPGFDFDPATGTMSKESSSHNKTESGGLHIAVSVFIGLVVTLVVSLVGYYVARKIKLRRGEAGDAAQNSTRDHSEAVNKLEADGGVLQEIMASFARSPNSTIPQSNGNGNHNGSNIDPNQVEVGLYSDKPRRDKAGRDLL